MRRLVGIAAVIGWLVMTSAAAAAPGDLESSFGAGGMLTTPFTGADSGAARGMVIQPDGRIVLAGNALLGGNFEFAIARYLPNGTLDQDFGDGGTTLTAINPASGSDLGAAVARQPDGKLVVAGSSFFAGNNVLALTRYHANGVLDSSFNGGGEVTTDVQTTTGEQADAVALQSSGKIVVAGYGQVGTTDEIVLARYLPSGTLDDSFGTSGNGKIVIPATAGHGEMATSLLVLPDDSLIVGGSVSPSTGVEQFMLRHLSKEGGIDTTFGDAAGRVITSFPSGAASERITGLAAQPDGRIVAVGSSFAITAGEKFEPYAARYMPNGALDPSFAVGAGREQLTLPGVDQASADSVTIAPDGRIVVGGATAGSDTLVVRLDPSGALDPTFGAGGVRVIAYGNQFDGSEADAVAVLGDGSVLAAGNVQQHTTVAGGFALAKLQGDSADLSVTESVSPSVVRPGGEETLTVAAHDAGPQAAHAVTLTITPPAGATSVTVTGSGSPAFSCSGQAPVTCTLASLGSGAASTLTVAFTAPRSGSIDATASISAVTADPGLANNSGSTAAVIDGTPPTIRLKLGNVSLKGLRKSGRLPVVVTLSEPGTVKLTARDGAHKLAAGSTSLRAAGQKTLALHVSRHARKRLKGSSSLKLTLSATATDLVGNTRNAKLTATIPDGG